MAAEALLPGMLTPSGCYPCWTFLECQGEVPQSRSGHTCALHKNRYLYIFGGFDGSSCFDDLYVLDLETRNWRKIEAGGDRPAGRASHSAVTDELAGVMYIFGGSGSHFGYTNKRDLCEFCFETESWRLLSNPQEDVPSARYGQSMVAYQRGLYVWGGTHGTNYPTDMHRFDLCSKQWEYVVTGGEHPCGRYRHQAMVKDDLMYIVGGSGINRYGDTFTFHFGTSVWKKLICTGTDLSDGRYAHSAVLRDGYIFLYGGNDGVRHDDLQQLDLSTKVWSRVQVHGLCPPGRDFHAAVLREDSMVIFGGSNGLRRHNDVFEFHMAPDIPRCTLSEDMEALLEEAQVSEPVQRSCDVLLSANAGEWDGVYCHSQVLAVRCPLLYKSVQEGVPALEERPRAAVEADGDGPHREPSSSSTALCQLHHRPSGWTKKWSLIDLPRTTLLHFVRFLYSETTRFGRLSVDQLYKLLLVARKLEVHRLAALCERQIKVRLSMDTVVPMLRAASADGSVGRSVLEACKLFFLANYSQCSELRECEALDPKLLCELMRLYNSRMAAAAAAASAAALLVQPATSPTASQPSQHAAGAHGGAPQVVPSPPAVSSPPRAEDLPAVHPVPLTALQPAEPAMPSPTLAQDLKRLLTEEIATDFEVVVQDEVIRVHRLVLVARSRYFASCILTSGMAESQAGRLVIPSTLPMTVEGFRAFLRFLYAGDDILGSLDARTAMCLVDASSFYGLTNQRLKHFCELCVKDSFNEAQILSLFEASSRLNLEVTQTVRTMALEFIITHFHSVCRQPALEQLDKSLLIEILRGIAEKLPQAAATPSPQPVPPGLDRASPSVSPLSSTSLGPGSK